MTDKEFKRLGRAQLIDIIYQLQLQVDTLTEQKQKLEIALADKQLRIDNAGSIADAALELNDCFRTAQSAAEQYLNEISKLRESAVLDRQRIISGAKDEARQLVEEAQEEATRLVTDAREEAARLVAEAQAEATRLLTDAQEEAEELVTTTQKTRAAYDAAVEAILQEFGQSEAFPQEEEPTQTDG